MDYTEKLYEINKSELRSKDGWKYDITTYEDETEVKYFDKNKDGVLVEMPQFNFSIPKCCDVQLCEKIIEMRKAFKE
jgi:hypothetical protein